MKGYPGSLLPEVLFHLTSTAHILGGCPMGDTPEDGVIDPCKVTTTALTNAVSVATVLVSTNCLVADSPEADEDEADQDDMDY